MARILTVVYVTKDDTSTFAHSDSEAIRLVEGILRVIGHTSITIYTSTRNVIESVVKLGIENDLACKRVDVIIKNETKFQAAVRRKLEQRKH